MQIPLDGDLSALLTSGRPGASGIVEALLGRNLSGLVLEKRPDGTVVLSVGDQKIPLQLAGGELSPGQEILFRLIRDKMGGLFLEILQGEEGGAPKADRVEALAWGRLAARWATLEPVLAALEKEASAPGVQAFLEPLRKFFQALSSNSPPASTPSGAGALLPARLPQEVMTALAAGESLARDERVPPQIRTFIREWMAEAKQLIPFEKAASPQLSISRQSNVPSLSSTQASLPLGSSPIKVLSGGEALPRLPAEPVMARVVDAGPGGRATLSFPSGLVLEVISPRPWLAGTQVRIYAQGGTVFEAPAPVALPEPASGARPAAQSTPAALTLPREEMVRQAVEFDLLKRPEDIVPEALRGVFERVSAVAGKPEAMPGEPESFLRQLLFTLSKGTDPAKVEPSLTFPREALHFGPRLFALIEQLVEAVPMPPGFYSALTPRPGSGGESAAVQPPPASAQPASKGDIPALAEVVRRLIEALVPLREESEGGPRVLKKDLRESHEQSGQFLEGKIFRGGLARLWNDKTVLSDLKANLLRLPALIERLEMPAESRARLLHEVSRLIQSIEAFQVKNLAEPETLQWALPLTGRDGPSTALVSFRRRGRRKKIDKDNASLNLRLALSALGAVEARVETRRGYLWVDFLIDRSEWEPLMKASLPELSERLQRTGFRVGRLAVSGQSKKERASAPAAAPGLDLHA